MCSYKDYTKKCFGSELIQKLTYWHGYLHEEDQHVIEDSKCRNQILVGTPQKIFATFEFVIVV